MARKDWYYANIPIEQAQALDEIVDKVGGKLGVTSKEQLIRRLIGDFIDKYEQQYGRVETRKAVRLPNGKDASRKDD